MSSSAAMEEILDLRGRPAAEQMRAAHEAVERAVGGAGMHILTDLEVVATYVLPAAAQRGLRCRVEPPTSGTRALRLLPADRTPADTESGDESGNREGNP